MAEEKAKEKETKKREKRHQEPPVWEWIVAAVGLILVAGAIGFMLYEAITERDAPPNFTVSVDSVTPSGQGFLVKFRVRNTGDQTAADVTIEGALKQGEAVAETSSVTMTYVPSDSEREGGLIFSKNPNQYSLEVRARSYEKP